MLYMVDDEYIIAEIHAVDDDETNVLLYRTTHSAGRIAGCLNRMHECIKMKEQDKCTLCRQRGHAPKLCVMSKLATQT